MNELGLAEQQAVGQGQAPQGQMPTVGQVVQMLMEGATPEELIGMGLPQELVEAAMQEIMAQQQVPQEEAGLAAMMVKPIKEGR